MGLEFSCMEICSHLGLILCCMEIELGFIDYELCLNLILRIGRLGFLFLLVIWPDFWFLGSRVYVLCI